MRVPWCLRGGSHGPSNVGTPAVALGRHVLFGSDLDREYTTEAGWASLRKSTGSLQRPGPRICQGADTQGPYRAGAPKLNKTRKQAPSDADAGFRGGERYPDLGVVEWQGEIAGLLQKNLVGRGTSQSPSRADTHITKTLLLTHTASSPD